MSDTNRIIEAYKNADFEQKLYYSLSYRSLRNTFAEIDNRERQLASARRMAAKPQLEKRSFLHRLLQRWGIKGGCEIRGT